MTKTDPVSWRGIHAIEKLFMIALPLTAVAVLALSFLDESLLRRLGRMSGIESILSWLANGFNAWFVFAGLLLLFLLVLLWVRHRIANNKHLWTSSGCPDCKERDLVRIKRRPGDRFYGLISVPVYRYACRNCTWRGLRVARREISPEREMEREEALLRFDPDSPLPLQTEDFSEAPDFHSLDEIPDSPSLSGIPSFLDFFETQEAPGLSEMDEPAPYLEDEPIVPDIERANMEWLQSQLSSDQPSKQDTKPGNARQHPSADPLDESFWLWQPDSDK